MALPAHPDAVSAWQALSVELRHQIGDSSFDIWLSPVRAESWDGRTLTVRAPADTARWLAHRYGITLQRAAAQTLSPGAHVAFAGDDPPGSVHGTTAGGTATPERTPRAGLHPRYRFEQFIIGEGNRLAHAAALAVAENPGQAYNPLFLYAPPGMGKTHLLHAIGNYIADFSPGAAIRYVTAESFTNHFLAALNDKQLGAFKSVYRGADVLLVDDIQFLASKVRTEEEFFHTFNALYENGRQLVLTCDRLPRALTSIEQRLRERFGAGLVADIRPPDQPTRVAILRKRAALDAIELDDAVVLEQIAERVTDNIRSLEGALIRVVAFHSLTRRPIDAALTAEVLDTMYPPRGGRPGHERSGRGRLRAPSQAGLTGPGRDPREAGSGATPPTIDAIQAAVAAHYQLTVAELTSARRTRRVSWPRQVAIHLARDLTGASLPAIGRAFGGRNHTTVLNACHRVSERLANDQQAVHDVDAMRALLTHGPADRAC